MGGAGAAIAVMAFFFCLAIAILILSALAFCIASWLTNRIVLSRPPPKSGERLMLYAVGLGITQVAILALPWAVYGVSGMRPFSWTSPAWSGPPLIALAITFPLALCQRQRGVMDGLILSLTYLVLFIIGIGTFVVLYSLLNPGLF
jgi:hypothetical protein